MLRNAVIALFIALLLAACGGESDSSSSGAGAASASNSDTPDPCTLADESVLETHFGDAPGEGERSEAGPIMSCAWTTANANSLLIQVAEDYDLYRPDPCDGCVDLSFGEDGYASESTLQTTATVVDGSLWLSVTTTGFRDDAASITDLLETVFRNATG